MGIRKFDSREDGLSGHPNFKMPQPLWPPPVADAPPSAVRDKELFMAGAKWGAECSAALLSPPHCLARTSSSRARTSRARSAETLSG